MVQRARDWLKEALAELSAARDLYKGAHWSWCCFTYAFDRGAPAEQFFEEDAREALKEAEEVISFAQGIIGPA